MNITPRMLHSILVVSLISAAPAWAQFSCKDLPSHTELTSALRSSVAPTGGPSNGGFDFHAWAVVVSRDGEVCAVTMSGASRGDQFPISRLAAAFKATTANADSLDFLAVSTALLHSGVRPGAPLFTLELASPYLYDRPTRLTLGAAHLIGTPNDPLVGQVVGGFSTLGGGLALYNSQGRIVGGLGVGGDTACGDHNIAWRVRSALALDNVPFGPNPQNGDDGIVYDVDPDGVSASGLGYPFCGFNEHIVAVEIGAGSVPAP